MKKPDTTQSSGATPQDAMTSALGTLQEAGLGPLSWLGTRWAEGIADLSSETLSFVAERVREDVKTQQEILKCSSLTEVQAVQTAFLKRAFDQYAAESEKIMKLNSELFEATPARGHSTPL